MIADTRQVVITSDVAWKALGVANEFHPDTGMAGADSPRGTASATETTVLNDSEQGQLVSSEVTGTTLLEVAPENRGTKIRPLQPMFKMEQQTGS